MRRKLSCHIITYNQKDYILKCIEGVLMQKVNFSMEIVIGDDNSTDGTREILKDYAKKYPDLIRLNLRKVRGSGIPGKDNFVTTLAMCNGEYISLCDGDDYWTDPLKLQKQVDFLEANEDYSVCFHPCETLKSFPKDSKCVRQPLNAIEYKYTIENLLNYWNIPTASIVFRNDKKLKLPYWFTNVASGDIALVMLYFEKGKFKLLKDYMSVYRIAGKGVSNTHQNYKMIYYRSKLYTHLNEYFDYKYEKEIYTALFKVYNRHVLKENKTTIKMSIYKRVKSKIASFIINFLK